jgi:transposase
MKAYIGADWSAKELACALRVEETGKLLTRRAQRTAQSVRELVAWARARVGEGAEIHVVLEDGAEGWAELLHAAGAAVRVVNPAKASAYAASRCSSHAKDDWRDADNLRSMGASPEHCPPLWEPVDEAQRELVELSSLHETLTADGTCWEQRLRALLREQFPAVESVLRDLSAAWVRGFLSAVPTPWHAKALTAEDLHQVLMDVGARSKAREQVLKAVAETETRITATTANAFASKVRMYVEHISLHTRQLKEVEEKLDACTAKFAFRAQLEAVDGVGVKMVSRILRFTLHHAPADRDEAAVLLGAAPIFQGSARDATGKVKGRVVMRKSVSPYARATAYLLGRLGARHLAWAGKMYEDGRARGQSAATAYRRIARSLLRILSKMAATGEAYDEARYIAGLKAKGVTWAAELPA